MKIWNYDLWYKLWKRLAKLLLYWNILTNMVSLGFSNQYVSLFQDRRIRYLNHLSKIFSLLRTCPRSVSVCVFVHCSFFFYGALGFSALCMSRCVKLSWEVSLCRRVNEGPEVSTQCWGIPRIAKLCYFCCVHPNMFDMKNFTPQSEWEK